MANWYGQTRTNYFRVTDEEGYQSLIKRLSGEDDIEDFSETKEDGKFYHAFGCYCDLGFYELDSKGNIDYDAQLDIYTFFEEIGKILEEGSAFVFMCTGAEKLRYLTGYCAIVFPDGTIESTSLDSFAYNAASTYYNDSSYSLMLNF